jgi:hypothetical protein
MPWENIDIKKPVGVRWVLVHDLKDGSFCAMLWYGTGAQALFDNMLWKYISTPPGGISYQPFKDKKRFPDEDWNGKKITYVG